jgi:hypothetical protein
VSGGEVGLLVAALTLVGGLLLLRWANAWGFWKETVAPWLERQTKSKQDEDR